MAASLSLILRRSDQSARWSRPSFRVYVPPVKFAQLRQTKTNGLSLVGVESIADTTGNGWYAIDGGVFELGGD